MARRSADWYKANGLPIPAWNKASPNYVPPAMRKDTVGNLVQLPTAMPVEETDEQIEARIKSRIEVFRE